MMARRYKRRRGIVILVVLSLLVLFVLLAVTFAIVAGQFQRAARAYGEKELLGVDPPKDLEKAFLQLLRDTPYTGSVARFHPLLRDMYGEDGFRGRLVDRQTLLVWNQGPANTNAGYRLSGGQFIDLIVDMAFDMDSSTAGLQPLLSTDGQNYTISQTSGYYNGCVLTITGGEAQGISTRIVGFSWQTMNNISRPVLRVMGLKADDGSAVSWSGLNNASFVVNGRQFSGTGFGYNTQPAGQARLDQKFRNASGNLTNLELALLPNYAALEGDNISRLLKGGSDEGYDAADFQNLAMAIIQTRPGGAIDRMPSFHRPTLVRYWRNREQTLWQNDLTGNFKRQFILRPIEPNFDGSNPDYIPPVIDYSVNPPVVMPGQTWYETGPWDVDNDGDGVRDSIWIDLGLPIQTAADGRKYKPLFAIMCRDMDGLLNVNAHGRIPVYVPNPPANDGDATTPLIYRKGLGYGPPEIDLRWAGITGNLTGLLTTRYGSDGRPGQANTYDQLARIRFFQEPKNYFFTTGARSSYSSHSDVRAELAFGVNLFGQPQFEQLPNADVEARGDSPYESNLVGGPTFDDPYTPAELERVLRRFDYDRSWLPNRLASYITNNASLITTDSFDVPAPSISAPSELVNYINLTLNDSDTTNDLSAHNVIDLLVARLQSRGITDPVVRRNQVLKMLSPDLAMGLKFDLNRPIGNARDGSVYNNSGTGDAVHQGVGIADEAALPTNNTELQNDVLYTGDNDVGRTEFNNVSMWHNNGFAEPDMDNNGTVDDLNGDGTIDQVDGILSRLLARQRYARHLYVLMLTLMDHGSAGGIPNAPDANQAEEVAQWAINAADFRDADSIMTPFEFDPNPFNGWEVDGVVNGYHGMVSSDDGLPNTQRRLVWGCERPELLLTGAKGFHARRTRDAQTDTTGPNHDLASGNDDDYDQEYLPFASAFVELYNAWAGADTMATPPRELYGNSGGVQLNRTTPSGNPVWRLLFINIKDDPVHAPASILNNSIDPDANPGVIDVDRAVYFIPNQASLPLAGPTHGRRQYYTDQRVAPILPGRYAVVGGGFRNGAEWVSPVGHIDPNTNGTDRQRIVLAPNADQVRVYPGTTDPMTGQPMGPEIAQAVAIVPNLSTVNPAARIQTAFSVSEPRIGYPISPSGAVEFDLNSRGGTPGVTPVPYNYSGVYENVGTVASLPYDEPLDKDIGDNNPGVAFPQTVARTNGTVRTFCRVYLQRLADPLQDYHAQANPFRTIDSIPMDLTVFNGRESFPSGEPTVSNTPGVDFSSLQRGDSDPGTNRLRLWPQEPVRTAAPAQAADPNSVMYFNYVLQHSLGKRNDNHPVLPNVTFPWFVWNNRPFVSPYELMHVSRFNSWELLKTTNVLSNFSLPSGNSPYDGQNPEYRHFLNFFHSAGTTPPHFYRIFDYVHVPSRFVATDTVLNPNYFGTTTNFAQPNFVSRGFLPPFNRVSRYRIPGLVNINTIPHAAVWNATRGPHVQRDLNTGAETPIYYGPNYSAIFSSREDGASTDVTLPTWFANPVRPMGSGDLVPVSSLVKNGIEGTLLRPNSTGTPLMETLNSADVIRHTRNSFFRYELLHRLGNMVTTRSNVYAIWITVGYFEMEPNYNTAGQVTYDMAHPEGLRVGQEIGIDTGEIRRHRAFYMVDRTIPVAFEPGQNHNVDKCVLVRRFIE